MIWMILEEFLSVAVWTIASLVAFKVLMDIEAKKLVVHLLNPRFSGDQVEKSIFQLRSFL